MCAAGPGWVLATLALLLLGPAAAEWVEIPQLSPSVAYHRAPIGGTASIKPTVSGRVNPSEGSLVHSHLLLAHLTTADEEPDSGWPPVASVRWHRRPAGDRKPVRDGDQRFRGSPWVTTFADRISLVNVSGKVEPWQTEQDAHEEQYGGEDEGESAYPVVQTQLLPFGNRYEEESIEVSSSASGGADGGNGSGHSVPSGQHPVGQQFDDFDDYDERVPIRQHQHHHQPHQPVASDEDVEGDEPAPPDHIKSGLANRPAGFGGFVAFLRQMQANFVLRAAHTIGDKIRTLAGLRDQLLSSIERRIAALWTVPAGVAERRRRRVKRGWMDPHAADAMDFPSAEGALLTISFLTFAVFLIKLVLQVINTIKAKHYTYSTFTAATPVSGGLLVKRTRRATDGRPLPAAVDRHYPAILGAIHSYKLT